MNKKFTKKQLSRIVTCINILLFSSFFFLPWIKLSITETGGGFSASALRLLLLIPRVTVTFQDYIGDAARWLKIGYVYAVIPVLVLISLIYLIDRRTNNDYYFMVARITYTVTIVMLVALIIIKIVIFNYYDLNNYQYIFTASFKSGVYISIILSLVGLKLVNMLLKDKTEATHSEWDSVEKMEEIKIK